MTSAPARSKLLLRQRSGTTPERYLVVGRGVGREQAARALGPAP